MSERQFGQRVRQLRLAKRWTLDELAALVECTSVQLAELERGQVDLLGDGLIERLADHLEADVDELYVLAGRLPPCLAWVRSDPGVVKLLGAMVALIVRRTAATKVPHADGKS